MAGVLDNNEFEDDWGWHPCPGGEEVCLESPNRTQSIDCYLQDGVEPPARRTVEPGQRRAARAWVGRREYRAGGLQFLGVRRCASLRDAFLSGC